MTSTNKLIIGAVSVLVVAGAIFFTVSNQNANVAGYDFSAILQDRPELKEFTDKIQKLLDAGAPDDELVSYYLQLGLAWKSLADRTLDETHYQKALQVYEKGIELSNGENTVFLNNAGNMSMEIKDYEKAKGFYEKAIKAAPGDNEAYVRLAELYRDYLGNDSETVIGIYNQGIDRSINTLPLIQRRDEYIESQKGQ